MEFKEIKKKSEAELHKLLKQYREKLRDMRFKVSAKQQKNIREIRIVRRVIARVLTLLNQGKRKSAKDDDAPVLRSPKDEGGKAQKVKKDNK